MDIIVLHEQSRKENAFVQHEPFNGGGWWRFLLQHQRTVLLPISCAQGHRCSALPSERALAHTRAGFDFFYYYCKAQFCEPGTTHHHPPVVMGPCEMYIERAAPVRLNIEHVPPKTKLEKGVYPQATSGTIWEGVLILC